MKTVYDERHVLHEARGELHRGAIHSPPFERAERAERVLRAVERAGLGKVVPAGSFGPAPVRRVHDAAYLDFLAGAHREWREAHGNTDALPHVWCGRGLRPAAPTSLYGRLGYYSFDAATPITAGTWPAAVAAADVALTAQAFVAAGERAAFALTRPPGHHAARDLYGGYCFINHSAVVAQAFRDGGAARVAVLDADYHHGNGTQAIFYDRADVLFVSLHADPDVAYPYFLGRADERGAGEGEGFNINIPLPQGTDWAAYEPNLAGAIERIAAHAPEALVVSLGVDTLGDDPISGFRFTLDDFTRLGTTIRGAALPTVFVMEGGYGEQIGAAVVNVLAGFEG